MYLSSNSRHGTHTGPLQPSPSLPALNRIANRVSRWKLWGQAMLYAQLNVMTRTLGPGVAFVSIAVAATINWPAFRGSEARGVADGKVPTSWNADATEGAVRNVRWKTA